ncbi:MAG TPA: amidohydrolase family protein [Pseudolabrys sp.]|nr:amidohydrolase family protein [Pseudolabrys sp.]
MRHIDCAHVLTGADGTVLPAQRIAIDGERIASLGPAPGSSAPLFAMPALVNAHDHGRAVRTLSLGAGNKPLESWIAYLALFPSVDPYLAAAVSLANSARGGQGTIMMHYTRAQGFTDLPTEAKEIARAARDVGVRVGFAVSLRDRNPLVYGPSEPILAALPPEARAEIEKRLLYKPHTPAELVALTEAVAAAAANPMFEVQYGPNGVQWCSDALLEAIAEASASKGRRIHMHLLETRYQRNYADTHYPDGVVKHLDKLGFLSERLSLAHCVCARPDELELLAERGVRIANNNSSNLHLRSGMAPVSTMLKAGCRLAIGVDATALDFDDDALRELRLVHFLHAGTGFKLEMSRRQLLEMGFVNGRFSVVNTDDGGRIAAGAPADLLLLDWAALDDEHIRDDVDPLELMLARATASHIRELIVAGRSVVKDGVVQGIDHAAARSEVLTQMRAGMAANDALARALPALAKVMASFYEPEAPCC